ncbi:uncharacterized protein ACMZJ9_009930 [Mantella aurantiaca]
MDKILDELHLETYKNFKLTLKEVLCISNEDEDRSPLRTTPSWSFLRKLIALDGTARNTRLDVFLEEATAGFSTEGNFFDGFEMSPRGLAYSVHPLDVLCAVMNCSDSFLQQEIVTKMSMCQFAVPLLLPAGDGSDCTFMLWAMRNIIKRWRPPSLLSSKGFKEENITHISMPIFAFVKLGDCSLSKSRVLNKILSPIHSQHDFFVHQDMECGYHPRTISEGLLEMSWYFPGGSENSNVFQEPIAVTNLRGDLISNQKQFSCLTYMSSAVFIFSEDIQEDHRRFLESFAQGNPSYFFVICPPKGQGVGNQTKETLKELAIFLNLKKNNILVKDSSMNEAEIVKQIQAILRNLTRIPSNQKPLADLQDDFRRFGILVDESSRECQNAKERAAKICRKIEDVSQYKKETLILQRDLWKKITRNEKEMCRMKKPNNVDVEDYKSKLITQNEELRKQQSQQELQGDIKRFLEDLLELSATEKLYYLRWMKFFLDNIARSNLSELQAEYIKYSTNIAELKHIDRQITDSSLGIENFLRELGQMHEAKFFDKNQLMVTKKFGSLPGIAADLLLEGFPLELIDGDSSSIPLQWITDVFNELDTKTGKRCTMKIITVLGVQSTGKSTLLNTMFGLQFPVASGRCTRGAFMTLLKVKENFQQELGCDFILVIDTEGLKAPELASSEDSYEHDNELATLVVGLSDITIVNMAMENTAEMKDILQIVVHAFLRMKEIGKKPNCQFIHQNVSDVSAHVMNIRHRKTLLEHLNEMTRAAAKMEKLEGITSFNDVMDYDLDGHTWYIPGLWYGVPPMAPVNNGYSEGILSIKKSLLHLMKKKVQKPQNIPTFLKWLQSLWTAVKHEKFIFSFRNSLVADAYNQLSVRYSGLEWSFRQEMYSYMTEYLNSIKNQQKSEMVNDLLITINTSMPEKLNELERKTQDSLSSFFESELENAHLVEKYLEDFSKSIDSLRRELSEEWNAKSWEAVGIQRMKCRIQDLKDVYSAKIEAEVSTLLESCIEIEGNISESELESRFEVIWEDTVKGFLFRPMKKEDVEQQMLQQLQKEMKRKSGVIHQQILNIKKLSAFDQASFVEKEEHIDVHWYTKVKNQVWYKVANVKNFYKDDYSYKMKKIAEDLMNKCSSYIRQKASSGSDYHVTFCQELLSMVNEVLEHKDVKRLHTTDQYELDLKLLVLGRAAAKFQEMHDDFVKQNDPFSCLQATKSQYLNIFKNVFQKKDECKNRAKQFCEQSLKPAIVKYVNDHLGREIVNDLLQGEDNMKYISRTLFQARVLGKLIEDGRFEQYVQYINNYEQFVKNSILEFIKEHYAKPERLESLLYKIGSPIMKKVRKTLQDVQFLESVNVSDFLSKIRKKLEKDLVILQDGINLITFQNSASVGQFSADVNSYLSKTVEDVLTEIGSLRFESLLARSTLKPEDELFKKVIGCGKQCPFCKVPCEAGCAEHTEHFATVHRPQGLGRYRFIDSNVLCSALCSTDVITERSFRNSDTDWKLHPYKEYQTFYPDWRIQPEPSISASDFWKFTFKEFNKQFAKEYKAKPANLPEEWYEISKEQAIESLKESYHMDNMSSSEEASQTIRNMKDKLIEIFEENVYHLYNVLDSLDLLSLEEFLALYDENFPVKSGKMIDIILQKGEQASKIFLDHLEGMIVRFPALSSLPFFHREDTKSTFQELVEQLDMKKHLTSKVTLRDILSIGSENLQEVELHNINEIPWHFLRNLMALNRSARNTQLKKDTTGQELNDDDDGDDDDMFDTLTVEHDTSSTIHPLDALCVLLHCSDNFLQQEIVTKMSMCQFAVPLLLPPAGNGSHCTFLLWAMRGIIKKWRPHSLLDRDSFREENVVNIPMPIFSFVRLGENKLSKTKLLNQILNPAQQHHNFFICHDMEGGDIKRKISDGLVEISWYLPCGNSDVFPEAISVTNLRGDLESSWNQFTFLTRVSSAVFIFIEGICESQFKLLSSCNNTETEFYFIITPGPGKEINQETQNFLKHLMETLNVSKKQLIVKRNNVNDAAFVKKIQSILKTLICKENQQSSLEGMKKETQGLQINVDENIPNCQKARACACVITSTIGDVEGYKKEVLKLQGDLWKQLSKVEKELCRMTNQGDKEAQQYKNELEQKRIALHKKQHEHDLPNPIMLFVTAITHLSQMEKQYFLKWMKLELDTIARKNLTVLQDEYKERCKSKSNKPGELKQIDQKISDSSLGIEHFLRELGQFYEAECSLVKEEIISAERAQFTGLPGIAADLLLDGFPLELIDGDASNIPMKWITDVLTTLSNKTEMKSKIRVITVLGVQSTGKSTLLNTMFGLQFPVASGRCTRGAFMTLLKVKKNYEGQLGCKFILVIDTEGLKAPELASLEDSYEHDNELATLVVGLSDVTIINMAMENTTEMKDILQIVVHAFLRMKKIGKKPNCQFVHQNVSDVSAHENNRRDRKKLQEQLDEMTKVAAKMEKQDGISSFSDVIDYDLEKHSWYIPGLWQGVPPMAPVNSGYSENVQKLKKHLFEFLRTQSTPCSIYEFITWIDSLWKGVKHEKFIFSFKNSLVADAYNKLSMQFSLWEWEFSKKVYNFVISTDNNIKNQPAESLDTQTGEEYRGELHQLVFEEETKMLDSIEQYFDSKSGNVHLIERYREDFRQSVQFLRRELERNALDKCSKSVSIKRGKLEIQSIQNQYQMLIEKKISSLLETGKVKKANLSSEEIQQEFESMWEKTMKDLNIKKLDKRNIDQTILQQLRHDLSSRGPAVHEKLKDINSLQHHGRQTFKMDEKYVDHSWWDRAKNKLGLQNQTFEKIENFALSLIDMCDKYVNKVDPSEDYDNIYSKELLYKINSQLRSNTNLHISRELELDIKLITLGNAALKFQQLHDTFIRNNDPTHCLESLKPEYLKAFLSIFQKKGESQNRAKQFCKRCLKPAITDYVFKHLGEKIVDDILNSSENMIFSSRSFFQCKMLEKLLEEISFQKYVEYISSYEKFSESWILSYISEKYKSPTTLKNLCKDIVSSITMEIETVLKEKTCLEMPTISSFLRKVCVMLKKKLVISPNAIQVIMFCNTTAVEQFSSDIQHFLTEMGQQILTKLGSLGIEAVLSKVTLKPQDELLRKVIGCGKQCPFCNVPCEAGGGEHKNHFASIHRSTGLGKYRWHKDETLTTDICSTLVVSQNSFRNSDTEGKYHPYKEYRKYYPDWTIQPDPNIECSDYWKYIFVQFNQQFAEEYVAKPAKLPEDWKNITEVQALNNLMQVFNMD